MIFRQSLTIACIVVCACAFPVLADDAPSAASTSPTRDYKGLFQVDLRASGTNRSILQDIGAGSREEFSVDSTRLYIQAAIKPLGFLEFYAVGGGGTLQVTNVAENKFYGRFGPLWGGGLRATLYESPARKNISVFIDAGYLQVESRERNVLRIFRDPLSGLSMAYRLTEEMVWREYAGLVGVRARFPFAGSPEGYGGVRTSMVNGRTTFSGPIGQSYEFSELGMLALVFGGHIFFDQRESAAFAAEVMAGEPSSLTAGVVFWF